jgi:ERI1 exoribonuclease 3
MLPAQMNVLSQSANPEDRSIPKSIPKRYKQWINLKFAFQDFFHMRSPPRGMTDMLSAFNMRIEGRHHSGIDDCKNIARVLLGMLKEDYSPSITGRAR